MKLSGFFLPYLLLTFGFVYLHFGGFMRRSIIYTLTSIMVFGNLLFTIPALAWVGDIPDSGCSALGLNYLNPDSPASIATDVIEQVAENYNGIYDSGIVADAIKIRDDTYVVGVDAFTFVLRFHSPTLPVLTYASSATFQDDLTLQVTGRRNLLGSVSGTDYSFTGNFGSSDTQNINSAECFDFVAGNPVYEANYLTNGGIIYENYTSGSSSGGSGWTQGTNIIPCSGHPYYTNSDYSGSTSPVPNTVIEEFNNGDFGDLGTFDINDPTHSAVMYRYELIAPYINQTFERAEVYMEMHPTEQIQIVPTDHDGVIYNDIITPSSGFKISSTGVYQEPIENDEAEYWFATDVATIVQLVNQASSWKIGIGAPICSDFAYNVDYDASYSDDVIEDNIAVNTEEDPPCDTFDVICHMRKISDTIVDGITEAFRTIWDFVWLAFTTLWIPPDGYLEVQFPELLESIDQQFGFLLYPLVFIDSVYDLFVNTDACGANCEINFGGFFGQDLQFSPIGVRESLPAVYSVTVTIVRALFAFAIVTFAFNKYKELFRR